MERSTRSKATDGQVRLPRSVWITVNVRNVLDRPAAAARKWNREKDALICLPHEMSGTPFRRKEPGYLRRPRNTRCTGFLNINSFFFLFKLDSFFRFFDGQESFMFCQHTHYAQLKFSEFVGFCSPSLGKSYQAEHIRLVQFFNITWLAAAAQMISRDDCSISLSFSLYLQLSTSIQVPSYSFPYSSWWEVFNLRIVLWLLIHSFVFLQKLKIGLVGPHERAEKVSWMMIYN